MTGKPHYVNSVGMKRMFGFVVPDLMRMALETFCSFVQGQGNVTILWRAIGFEAIRFTFLHVLPKPFLFADCYAELKLEA